MSCIERHRSHLVTFLKISSWIAWFMTFWNRHRMSPGAQSPTKPIFYDENKRHKHYNFRHKFNCHISLTFHVSSHVTVHVNLHVITAIHVITMSAATSSSMSSMCDMAIESVTKIILFVTFIFVIENGFRLGVGGRGHFMTVSKCHRPSSSWRNFKKRHKV